MDWSGIWQGAWPGQWDGQGEPGGGPVYADTGFAASGGSTLAATAKGIARVGFVAAGTSDAVFGTQPAPPVQQPGGGIIREAYRPKRRPRVSVYANAGFSAHGSSTVAAGAKGSARIGAAIFGASAVTFTANAARAALTGMAAQCGASATFGAVADTSKLVRRRRDEEWLLLLAA